MLPHTRGGPQPSTAHIPLLPRPHDDAPFHLQRQSASPDLNLSLPGPARGRGRLLVVVEQGYPRNSTGTVTVGLET